MFNYYKYDIIRQDYLKRELIKIFFFFFFFFLNKQLYSLTRLL